MPVNNIPTFSHLNEKQQLVLSRLSLQVNKVFVTGAGGFLGKALCRFLRSADINVVGFARGDYPELEQMGVTM
ncbi:MAG: FlaA1/EpsC-like NDP-sugar epimerase, partial [Marinobacter maritimus]